MLARCNVTECCLELKAIVGVLQAFEKATGKMSSQNKEAFRAALVGGCFVTELRECMQQSTS